MNFEEQNNTIYCRFSKDLNADYCAGIEDELSTRVNAFLEDHDAGRVEFDLSEVQFVSSAFLRLCLYCCKAAGTNQFAITHCPSGVLQVFRISGFTEMMNVS